MKELECSFKEPTFTWSERYIGEEAEKEHRLNESQQELLDQITTPINPVTSVHGHIVKEGEFKSHTPYVQNGKVYCSYCGEGCSLYPKGIEVDKDGNLCAKRDNRYPRVTVKNEPVFMLGRLAAEAWEENQEFYQGIGKAIRTKPKHQSTFDIVKTRIKNRKRNKLAKKARRK